VRYRITHRTEYVYEAPVTLCHNQVHLKPRDTPTQRVLRHQLDVDPPPALVAYHEDFFGNPFAYVAVQVPHARLVVTASSEVERDVPRGDPLARSLPWEEAAALTSRSTDALGVRQHALPSPMVPAIGAPAAYAAPSFHRGRPLLPAVHDLMGRIHTDFTYAPGTTTIATPLAEVFAERRGVCQDFAHIAIACLRALGLAARYVSGYIETTAPPGRERIVGGDASHAWFAVWDPTAGWVDFDPTNAQLALGQHVTTAWGRDYGDVTPMKGIIFGGGARHTARVSVDAQRLDPA
jgi:transglutaminase-like putative cysteine protease